MSSCAKVALVVVSPEMPQASEVFEIREQQRVFKVESNPKENFWRFMKAAQSFGWTGYLDGSRGSAQQLRRMARTAEEYDELVCQLERFTQFFKANNLARAASLVTA